MAVLGLTTAAVTMAGCGSVPATGHDSLTAAAGIAGPALTTTLSASNGTSWAVLELGGSAATHNDFWELFVRPPGSAGWQLATPAGVASNGGMVAAPSGPAALIAAFRPSQDLTFSPLAATADAGHHWAQANVLDTGIANLPGALAADAGGRLLALTQHGVVEESTNLGATWSRLSTLRAIARTPAVRASCSLTALTAVALTAAGVPLVGASCATAGHGQAAAAPQRAGLLAATAGSWRPIGPVLPAALARGPVTVLGLAASGTRLTAILAAGAGPATSVLAAWSADNGASWTISPAERARTRTTPSVSIWADGSAGLVLSAGRAVTIGWRAAWWRVLPRVPARTAALAQTAGGQPEALAPDGSTLTVWQLGGPAATAWTRLQTVHVTIPYGSSG